MRRLAPLLLFGLGAVAHAAEYRQVELSDGRVLTGEIGSMTEDALVLVLPQGETHIELTQVLRLDPSDANQVDALPPWRLLILPSAYDRDALVSALGQIPQTQAPTDELPDAALSACVGDLDCALPLAQGYTAVVTSRIEDTDGSKDIVVSSVFVGAPRARREVALDASAPLSQAGLTAALRAALFLEPVTAPEPPPPVVPPTPPVAQTPPEPQPSPPASGPTTGQLTRMAWWPAPGVPSLARRDLGGFAQSWGVVVPGTVLMVGAAGYATTRPTQLAAVGVLSYYALTVATNRAIGLRGLRISPTPVQSGAGVALSWGATPQPR